MISNRRRRRGAVRWELLTALSPLLCSCCCFVAGQVDLYKRWRRLLRPLYNSIGTCPFLILGAVILCPLVGGRSSVCACRRRRQKILTYPGIWYTNKSWSDQREPLVIRYSFMCNRVLIALPHWLIWPLNVHQRAHNNQPVSELWHFWSLCVRASLARSCAFVNNKVELHRLVIELVSPDRLQSMMPRYTIDSNRSLLS